MDNDVQQPEHASPPSTQGEFQDKTGLFIYILYLASFVVGISYFIGGVWAYVADQSGDARIQSHIENAKKIFLWGLVGYIVGFILTAVFVGVFVIIGVSIWILYRTIKGIIRFNKGEAYPL